LKESLNYLLQVLISITNVCKYPLATCQSPLSLLYNNLRWCIICKDEKK